MKRFLSPIAFSLLALASCPACNKTPDLSPMKAQAEQLVAKYLPKVQAMTTQLEGLATRAKTLPESLPGVADLNKLIADHQGKLGQIKSLLDNAASKVTDGVKAGSKEQIAKIVTELNTDVGASINTITTDLTTLAGKLEELEKSGNSIGGMSATLSTGFEIKASSMGLESRVLAFLADASKPIDEATWFAFEALSFKEGSAEIELETSQAQLTNLVEILKAYPTATIKIGGYTDNVGDAKANLALSSERANAVLKAIAAAGIDEKRLSAEGYGSAHPACEKDASEECLAQNRRIAIRFITK
ncbi:MAG: OmpA family protein [Myxococcales bacterium]|nr:OmpA family protein [Myxococcales bacterium]